MKVLLFARARELAGVAEIEIDMVQTCRVADLRREFANRFPKLASFLPHCAVAVNDEYAPDDAIVANTDRIALLPPVSGG